MLSIRIVVLSAFVATTAFAQSYRGAILGVVSDSTRPLPGAAVTLIQTETNRERTATAGTRGEYAFTQLPPGTYKLSADLSGFRAFSRDIELLVNQEVSIDAPMYKPDAATPVQVAANAEVLRTQSSSLGAVIEPRDVTALPLDGRNFYQLSLLAPGVAPAAQGSAGSVRGDFSIHVNGAREDANGFLLDGMYNGDPKLNGYAVNPPVDAIREFEVATSTYDASFGRNAGGQVNVITKSGTNTLHGTAYEFFRNGAMDARNYFAPSSESAPAYRRNQYGASLGGPVRKNRTFFFADFEGRRVTEGVTQTTKVATALERIGDFSQSGPRATPIDLFTQAPFPGSKIPAQRLHPIGAGLASLYPLPNRSAADQNYVSSPVSTDKEDRFDVRLDHAIGKRDDFAFRYSFGDRSLFEPFSGAGFSQVPGYGSNVPRRAQNAMFTETHVFAPSLINEVRVGFNRVANGVFQENIGASVNQKLGLPVLSSNPRDNGLSFISVAGYSPLGDEYNNPQHGVTNTYQVQDLASYTRGRHYIKFGFDSRSLQQNAYRDVLSRGLITFVGFTGNALSELLQGFPAATVSAKLDNYQHFRNQSYNVFANDSWRVTQRLTLNYGIRYEYTVPGYDTTDRANTYDPARGALFKVGTNGIPRGVYQPDRNNLAPRLGLAYSLNASTVIRAGYGIYYDQSALAPGEALYFNSPYFDSKTYVTSSQFFLLLHDPFPKNYPYPSPSSALAIQKDLRTGYLQQYNFTLQRQLGRSRVLEVGYVGSKGTKLVGARDLNQPKPSTGQFYLRPNFAFEDVTYMESNRNSNYNSLQARFQQRLAQGLSALGSYTFSKSIDNASAFFATAGDPNFPQDSYNLRAERGRSAFDLRHRFSLSYAYDLPIARSSKWWGGWQTSGVWSFQGGRPFTVALSSDLDNSNTGRSSLGFGANDRPYRVASGAISSPTPEKWFDTSAFVKPPYGSFGNSGRNILDGPGLATMNMSLLKRTRFGDNLIAEFRLEAFNLFDRTNFDLPGGFQGTPLFGRILSAQAPRHMQLGFKLLW